MEITIGVIQVKNNRIVSYIYCSFNNSTKKKEDKQSIIMFAKREFNIDEKEIDFYIDIGKRTQRDYMMERICNKEYDVLLLHHCSHLHKISRKDKLKRYIDMDQLINLRDTILNNGVKIYSVKENKYIE